MQITRATDYAVRAILHLARRAEGETVPAAEIARREDMPPAYVIKVVQALARARLVVSRSGRSGGTRLARPAREISVLNVVEAMEGPIALNKCTLRPGECPRDDSCPVHDLWAAAEGDLERRLARADFARLARRAGPIGAVEIS